MRKYIFDSSLTCAVLAACHLLATHQGDKIETVFRYSEAREATLHQVLPAMACRCFCFDCTATVAKKKGAQFERGAEDMETFRWIWMFRFSNLVLRRKKRFTPTPEISKTDVFLKFGFRSPQPTSENMICMGKCTSVSNMLYSKHIAVSHF